MHKRFERVPMHKPFIIVPKFPRNLKFHELMFATLSYAVETTKIFGSVDDSRHALLVQLGYFRIVKNPFTGQDEKVPRSMAFESMSEQTAKEFYEKATVVLIGAGYLPKDWNEEDECGTPMYKIYLGMKK
jgi:hypothetical protein